ncbi:SpoIIE family protein phosphatase [Streptomyces sp. NPDC058001]|uniref:SpoIIE family protein phosphatase n=1 Tax=Streptomyces sp. NPDC058001 TaxID=3346300 RepID=UPI0036E78ED9
MAQQRGDETRRLDDDPFEEAATAYAEVDPNGTVTAWNEGARQLLGHTPDQALGRPATAFLAGPQSASLPLPGSTRWHGTLTLRHRDGGVLPVRILAHMMDPDKAPDSDWLLVCRLPQGEPALRREDVATWEFTQSPCPTAIYDTRLRLITLNDAMVDVIGLPEEEIRGLRLSEIGGKPASIDLERDMLEVVRTGRREHIETYMRTGGEFRDHAWSAHMTPLIDDVGTVRGVCLTAHDITERDLGRRRLSLVNEASVRIGTTLDITRTAEELADVCVPELADFVTVDLLDTPWDAPRGALRPIPEPPEGGDLVLIRAAHNSVNEGCPEAVVEPGEAAVYEPSSPHAVCLALGRALIISESESRARGWPPEATPRGRRARKYGMRSIMAVPVQARGTTLGVAVFYRLRQTEAYVPDDLLLAEEITARAAVCVDNARRFTRERETALALQRSLLPGSLPRPAAMEAASGYLPAALHDGVGGDWFDVIPLSGLRVALVVGDVVGHGIQASATMGRLRTAVGTLADVDLPPDDLLTHLDDLVIRLSQEESDGGALTGGVGATCLYAVYDPVSRICSMASAGHPPPALVLPDGTVSFIDDLAPGPPLGVGGLPFELVERKVPEGTLLALYTDGLVESRTRDIDEGRVLLARALGGAHDESVDSLCRSVLRELVPVAGGVRDDVALLLARTRALDASRVRDWDIPADPAAVAVARSEVADQLARWGGEDLVFTTELIVSELVTNAVRHGSPPIRLRLIHNGTLICEVSDASNTSPHLRRARAYDEGGRGLLLVAQIAQRWGCRHHAIGKTIWAEQPLPG